MDQSITERPQTEAEKLLAHHPSTKHLAILMTDTPTSNQVAAHGYDLANKTLCVRFKWGNSEYYYHWVEFGVVVVFVVVKFGGGFLEECIGGVYCYECIGECEVQWV